MTRDRSFKTDIARSPARPSFRKQSICAIWVYRLGRRAFHRKQGPLRSIELKFQSVIFRRTEAVRGVSLPPEVKIGSDLRIYHFGNMFVHARRAIGCNCTLRYGVTIGNLGTESPVPIIEDDVEFDAYAQILGDVCIRRGAKIGARSVVLSCRQEHRNSITWPVFFRAFLNKKRLKRHSIRGDLAIFRCDDNANMQILSIVRGPGSPSDCQGEHMDVSLICGSTQSIRTLRYVMSRPSEGIPPKPVSCA
jgi:serine O-acetyltransferase